MTRRAAPHPVATVRDPADLVRLVPYLLGFAPAESLVLVCLRGPRRRVGLTMRLDLPAADEEPLPVHDLARRAAADGAAAVVLLCFTEAPDDGAGLPRRALLGEVVEAVGLRDVAVSAAVLVRGGRWWSYLCGAACCPPEGAPVPDDAGGPVAQVAAAAVLAGRSVLTGRTALRDSVRPPPSAGWEQVARQRAEVTATVRAAMLGQDAATTRADTARRLEAAVSRRAEGGPGLSASEATWLVLGLRDVGARDAALAAATCDDPVPWLAVLTELAQVATAADAAPVCAVLAVAAYAHGDGALANVAVERALDAEPEYSLALLVLELMHHQVPPGTVRQLTREPR